MEADFTMGKRGWRSHDGRSIVETLIEFAKNLDHDNVLNNPSVTKLFKFLTS